MKQVTRKILQINVQSVQKITFMLQLIYIRTFLVAHLVKNPPAMRETWVQSRDWTFLPRESHGQRRLVGYSPLGRKELDMTEQLSTAQHTQMMLLDTSSHWKEPRLLGEMVGSRTGSGNIQIYRRLNHQRVITKDSRATGPCWENLSIHKGNSYQGSKPTKHT